AHALGAGERRQAARHTAEDPAPLLLRRFDLLPVAEHLVGILRFEIAEDVRVAVYELLDDPAHHVVDREAPLAPAELRLEDDLKQQIAELLAERFPIAGVDRVDHLARLFEDVPPQRLEALLAIPRAPVRREEAAHHPYEARQRGAVLERERRNRAGHV